MCVGALGFYTYHVLRHKMRNLIYPFAAALVLHGSIAAHTESLFHCTRMKTDQNINVGWRYSSWMIFHLPQCPGKAENNLTVDIPFHNYHKDRRRTSNLRVNPNKCILILYECPRHNDFEL